MVTTTYQNTIGMFFPPATPVTFADGLLKVALPMNVTPQNVTDYLGTGTPLYLGTTTMGFVLGGDASYDTYYRSATGVLARLANGTTGQMLGANTGAAPSWVTPTTVTSGTHTPGLTNFVNVTSSTPRKLTYSRVGNTVSIGGQVDIKAGGAGAATILMSIPIASAFVTIYQAGGSGVGLTGTGFLGATIQANTTFGLLEITFMAGDTSTRTFSFTAIYEIV